MASVDFRGKCKGGAAAKAIFRHCAIDTRIKGKHANKDIDLTKTPLNTSLYGLTYDGLCEKYDVRIKELDSSTNTNKRKDRVTLMGLSIPVPENMPADKEDDFFRSVSELLIEKYGEKNLIDVVIHRDEQHIYLDPDTKELTMSRTHAHCFIVPEQDGRLNAKGCSCRSNINAMNRGIDDMCREKYGLPFMTGAKAKSRGKVEEMKVKSAIAVLEEAKRKEAALSKRESELKEREELARVALDDAQEIADAKAEKKVEALLDFCKNNKCYVPMKNKAGQLIVDKKGNEVGKYTGRTIFEQYQLSQERKQQAAKALRTYATPTNDREFE